MKCPETEVQILIKSNETVLIFFSIVHRFCIYKTISTLRHIM